ncbi:PolC-type DNA polymerase III [Micromonospora sp. LOL_021]|uniref:3'-5' exonuclease n=1 Tax=Micromonospora sp. LOL_021 TaxID=3345417 RepID=UPI003A8B156C
MILMEVVFMFTRGELTRRSGADPRALTYAVIDLETTGLHPNKGSRVCELAIVRMRGDGVVLDEYSTLINPGMRINNDEYHGITNADVKHAPTFQQAAGDVLAYLRDAVVVSHNLDHEEKFLIAEFGRLGVNLSGLPGLCSLVTARTQIDSWGYKLENVHHLVTGEWLDAVHSALGDARALAVTLTKFINEAPQRLSWIGPQPAPIPALPRTGIVAPRAAGLRKGTEGWLATLTARLPRMAYPPQPRPGGLADYRALLGHALADGRIVGEEANQLAVAATNAGLTQTTARQVHEEFLADARARAEADGVVTPAELRELQRAGRELASSHLISDLEEAAAANRARANGPLKGWRILPVGDSPAVTEVIDYAVEHGAKAAVSFTKTVRLVVCDDPLADDPRLAKPAASGVDVLAPEHARKLLEDEAAKRATGLFADQAGEQVAQRIVAERANEGRQSRPEWHGSWRKYELTDAQYHQTFVVRDRTWNEPYVHQIDLAELRERQARAASATRSSGCAVVLLAGGAVAAGLAELVRQIVA